MSKTPDTPGLIFLSKNTQGHPHPLNEVKVGDELCKTVKSICNAYIT